jgi:hypothetical protein
MRRVGRWVKCNLLGIPAQTISPFRLNREEAEARRSGGAIEEIFFSGKCRLVHKWIDYLPIYERLFAPYRGTNVTMIEIGVSEGGSLDMWREYFGPNATIFGIDIEPSCAEKVDAPNQVRIGSQNDQAFLKSIIEETGAPDIILDDGSHVADHQIASFRHLWPELKDGGLYIVEDTHTAYWPRFRGGYRKKGTAIELSKSLADDMHGWYHTRKTRYAPMDEIAGVHIFDSITAVEKRKKLRPGHIKIERGHPNCPIAPT